MGQRKKEKVREKENKKIRNSWGPSSQVVFGSNLDTINFFSLVKYERLSNVHL